MYCFSYYPQQCIIYRGLLFFWSCHTEVLRFFSLKNVILQLQSFEVAQNVYPEKCCDALPCDAHARRNESKVDGRCWKHEAISHLHCCFKLDTAFFEDVLFTFHNAHRCIKQYQYRRRRYNLVKQGLLDNGFHSSPCEYSVDGPVPVEEDMGKDQVSSHPEPTQAPPVVGHTFIAQNFPSDCLLEQLRPKSSSAPIEDSVCEARVLCED